MFQLFDPVWECVFDLDFSYKFSNLQHNSVALVAGLKRATDEGSLPEIAQYSPYYLPLNVFYCFQRTKPLKFNSLFWPHLFFYIAVTCEEVSAIWTTILNIRQFWFKAPHF